MSKSARFSLRTDSRLLPKCADFPHDLSLDIHVASTLSSPKIRAHSVVVLAVMLGCSGLDPFANLLVLGRLGLSRSIVNAFHSCRASRLVDMILIGE